MSDDELLMFSGINGETGRPVLEAVSTADILRAALDLPQTEAAETLGEHLGVIDGIDGTRVAESGWGIVFPYSEDVTAQARIKAIHEALKPLIRHRAALFEGRLPGEGAHLRIFEGPELGFRSGDTKTSLLERLGIGFGSVDPRKIPYYLLLVGTPTEIPLQAQAELDVQFAVGRLDLREPEDYRRYAQSVIAAERRGGPPRKAATFWAPQNPDDPPTDLALRHLVRPLVAGLQADAEAGDLPGWQIELLDGAKATKTALKGQLGGQDTPAFLFTASHGVHWPVGHPQHPNGVGALITQGWRRNTPVAADHSLGAADLEEDRGLGGLIAFLFACFGAGTSAANPFKVFNNLRSPSAQAVAPFTAALPQRMLAHPAGGALAVLAHYDEAFAAQFMVRDAEGDVSYDMPQITAIRDTVRRLLRGEPVGHAARSLNIRYSELTSALHGHLNALRRDRQEAIAFGEVPAGDDDAFIELIAGKAKGTEAALAWFDAEDARRFVVLGDPAVSFNPASVPERGADAEVTRSPGAPGADLSLGGAWGAADPAGGALSFGIFGERFRRDKDPAEAGARDLDPEGEGRARGFLSELTTQVGDALREATTLSVKTYTTTPDGQGGLTRAFRAGTELSLTGDIKTWVPEDEVGAIDMALWEVHTELVKQAQENRAKLLKLGLDLAFNLARAAHPKGEK